MPYRQPDPSDPHLLVGVGLPAEGGTMAEMADVFAEEFARMGFDARRVLGVFAHPLYAGAHHAYQALGEAAVREIVGASWISSSSAVAGRRIGRNAAIGPSASPGGSPA